MAVHDTVILADGVTHSANCPETGRNDNILVCGGSGSGKTVSFTEPCILGTYERNLIVTVTKHGLVDKYTSLLQSRGYSTAVLDFTDASKSTHGYDQLLYATCCDDIGFVARSVVLANPDKEGKLHDPYWDMAASGLLAALIAGTMATTQDASFADVIDCYKSLKIDYSGSVITTNLDGFFKRLDDSELGSFAKMNWRTFRELPPKTASCVLSTLGSTIGQMFDPELMAMMRNPNKLDFAQFAKRKSVLFVVTSPVNPALDPLISQFYANALKQLFEYADRQPNGKLPPRFTLSVMILPQAPRYRTFINTFPSFAKKEYPYLSYASLNPSWKDSILKQKR